MLQHEIELTVGEVIRIGEFTLTVIDLENGEVTFRVQKPMPEEDSPEDPPTTPRPK